MMQGFIQNRLTADQFQAWFDNSLQKPPVHLQYLNRQVLVRQMDYLLQSCKQTGDNCNNDHQLLPDEDKPYYFALKHINGWFCR